METHKNQINDITICSESVFKSIYNANFKLIRNYLIYKFKDVDQAEDLAQNAFVKLWENCKILKIEQSKKFLYTTAVRMALNQIKHDKVVSTFKLQLQPETTNFETPHLIVVGDELKEKLELAIQNLPEKQRIVFLMNRFDNQSYTEIASLLNLSVKAVEKRMHLALLTLRKVIK